ncbi:MAG: metalloregulator ArsR/SmtB family transcription factor [Desulfovibrio sp.]|nr:metalloregulator ArsR/SmtB family transcription factor [Desulfovibrio sp.]MBQ1539545.1 metalloregulator ArsR/SmtB family transcription factor [Desulfovibrio sp.]MBQ2477368.1 metalloregulator ArsR/SmtB family transcription factor [Desulfovibrio sp.]MBQ2516284.1 metalloregulator ArsR/SmtB family transcription factor [Desulfovibrio sp.]
MTVTLFKALADATRIRLLRLLIKHELSVNELVKVLKMGQSRISRHLRVLSDAGLLTNRRDGLWVFYHANADGEQKDFLRAVAPYLEDIPQGPEDTVHCNRLLEEKNAKTRQFFNSVAEDWDNLSKEVLEGFDLPQTVCDVMPERCRLAVDLGCGTGTVLVRMLSRAEGVVGVDGSQAMLDICRKRFSDIPGAEQKISLRLGGLDHLPLRDQEADFASINLVLHHLEELSPALAEARRILNGQGRLFISDFLRHDDETMRTRFGDRWLGFEESKLAIFLREAGFNRTHIRKQKVGRGLTLLLVTSYVDPGSSRLTLSPPTTSSL